MHETLAFTDYRLRGPIPTCPHHRQGTTDGRGRLREGELAPGDYVVEVGDSFAVVGARYAAICYVDDRPDVYRLPGYGAQVDPGSPRVYERSWKVPTSTSPGDFADGLEDETGRDDALDESA